MKRVSLAIGFLVVVAAVSACEDWLPTKVLPGRTCFTDKDCPASMTCDPQAGVCRCAGGACPDGGDGGAPSDGGSPADARVDAIGTCGRDADCGGSTPVCGPAGRCVQCSSSAQCADPTKPICQQNSCVGCGAAGGAQACASAAAPGRLCAVSGACVECTSSSDCSDPTKPICQANKCSRCTTDAECAAKPGGDVPGICMSHQDGRCATGSETIFLDGRPEVCVEAGLCSSGSPCCSLSMALAQVTPSRRVIAVRGPTPINGMRWKPAPTDALELSMVGKNGAAIAFPGLDVTAGALFARDLTVRGGDIGISAVGGSLRLQGVRVMNNAKGGIFVDGASFDIENTFVTQNGPGELPGGFSWGGVRVQSPGNPSRFKKVSVIGNTGPGVSCSAAVMADGLFATGNSPDIAATCAAASCAALGPGCGADLQ